MIEVAATGDNGRKVPVHDVAGRIAIRKKPLATDEATRNMRETNSSN
jgi:hypothetical protein